MTVTGPRVSGSQYRLGQSLTITTQGNPSDPFAHVVDLFLSSPPLQIPPVSGNFFLTTGCAVITIGALDGSGLGAQTIAIPSVPTLAGLHLYFQGVTGSSSYTWTNAVDVILQP